MQFDFEGSAVVGPSSAVVSGGSDLLGSSVGLTGFKHAEYDSKLSGLCYDKVISDWTRTSPSQMASGVSLDRV